ncbi:MAG: fumarylacetoacetate hydrolase family protein [Pseudomonadota bacterium]
MFTVEPTQLPTSEGRLFPVRRIFCIGKNYADHVVEMGGDPKKTPPVFFTKPADAASTAAKIDFPLATDDLHYEGELVVALKGGGTHLAEAEVADLIFGYACGCDLTRRDLQMIAKENRAPWDLAKALDQGAMIGTIAERPGQVMREGAIQLSLNEVVKQNANLRDMVWSIPEIIAKLSTYFELKAGDLVFTGTPSGVSSLARGDRVCVAIADLPPLRFSLA